MHPAPLTPAPSRRDSGRCIPVVFGGPHHTRLPDEAQSPADVTFVGEAELAWSRFLAEFEAGNHRSRYGPKTPALDSAHMARSDLYHQRDDAPGALFATRGGTCRCDFCTPAVLYRGRIRKRPVEGIPHAQAPRGPAVCGGRSGPARVHGVAPLDSAAAGGVSVSGVAGLSRVLRPRGTAARDSRWRCGVPRDDELEPPAGLAPRNERVAVGAGGEGGVGSGFRACGAVCPTTQQDSNRQRRGLQRAATGATGASAGAPRPRSPASRSSLRRRSRRRTRSLPSSIALEQPAVP